MPLVKTSAIILKSRRWGDADRIVTCYTLRFGKIRAVARGARRMKSRLGGSIEPFVLCQMDLFEKPGDSLYRLSQVAMQESFLAFREDLTLMTAAARMVNLVAAVVAEGDPDPPPGRLGGAGETLDPARLTRGGALSASGVPGPASEAARRARPGSRPSSRPARR